MILPEEFKYKVVRNGFKYRAKLNDIGDYFIWALNSNGTENEVSPVDVEHVTRCLKDGSWVFIQDSKEDIINKPSHYHKNGIDVNGYLEQHFPLEGKFTVPEGFYIGNTIKYVSRYKEKNGLEDLEKAAFYLGKLIDIEKARC